ncbi:LamG domain-containing protein [Flammeovirgaceae bacterium SG7u.132]|nr:LamG domain-containing protein [Flammeovirgaceae bacterium SG7u.132]
MSIPEMVFAQNINLNSGLVLYLPFNGNLLDSSGHDINGMSSGVSFVEDLLGNPGHACYFDGYDDFIDLGYSPLLKRYKSDFSLNVWLNLEDYSRSAGYIILSNRGNDTPFTGSAPSIEGYGNSTNTWGRPVLTVKGLGFSSWVFAEESLDLERWYMVTITFNFNQGQYNVGQVYVNCKLSNINQQMDDIIDPGATPTYIGYEPEITAPIEYHYKGRMDELRLYDRVLNQEEVEALYFQMKPIDLGLGADLISKCMDFPLTLSARMALIAIYGIMGVYTLL